MCDTIVRYTTWRKPRRAWKVLRAGGRYLYYAAQSISGRPTRIREGAVLKAYPADKELIKPLQPTYPDKPFGVYETVAGLHAYLTRRDISHELDSLGPDSGPFKLVKVLVWGTVAVCEKGVVAAEYMTAAPSGVRRRRNG